MIVNGMISVIVPVYNSEKYLSKCLESIIKQTYKDIEIICVDDGSKDASLKILREYVKKDDRIRIIYKENEGVSLARNTGLEIVKGEYILFVDSDDWIDRSTCEKAVKQMREGVDLVMWSYIRERGGESRKKEIFDKDIVFTEEEVKRKLHRRMIGIVDDELSQPENADALCTVWGKLYRKSIICDNNIKFYDIREIGTYEDGLFNLIYLQYVRNAVFLNQYFYHYRRTNESSITGGYNAKLERQWRKLFNIMKDYIEQNNLDCNYKKALKNRISLSLIPLGINEMTQECFAIGKIRNIKRIISRKEYSSSVKKLKIQYMPFYWKIFFKAAQAQNAVVIFVFLYAIQKIRGR